MKYLMNHVIRQRSVLFALCTVLFVFSQSTFARETIRITTGEFPPFLSENLKHGGVGLRIITEVFDSVGIDVEYGFYPWKRAYALTKEGKWDASATWAHNPEREQIFHYSDPLYNSTYTFFHLKTFMFDWTSITDLKGLKIGATSGYNYTKEFWLGAKEGWLNVDPVTTDIQNMRMVLLGRNDVFPINTDVGYFILNKEFTSQERLRMTHHSRPFSAVSTHLIFSRNSDRSERLLALFNDGLQKMKASGKVKKYFDESRKGVYLE